MDHRENQDQNTYQKELEQSKKEDPNKYDDKVMIDGHPFRIPYKIIKEAVWSGVSKEEMVSMEHAARIQYRLMLLEPIIRAKIEFMKQKVTIIYNPDTAVNRKEKISMEELVKFMATEGVKLDPHKAEMRDFDYVNEMYKYQFDPPTVRERPPYGYTMEEWKKMKGEYTTKINESKVASESKFKGWQDSYAGQHPEVFGQSVVAAAPAKKPTLMQKLFGKKDGKKKDEKQFWFHGV